MLDIKGLRKSFGGLSIFTNLDLKVEAQELRCIIGPNGTGKTTLFNLITGQLKPDGGVIAFQGRDIGRLRVDEINRLGIGRKFQSPTVFEEMNVWDNLIVAGTGHWAPGRLFSSRVNSALEDRAEDVLRSIRLAGQRQLPASKLSHGQKQWLEIGMVMLNDPRLVLLDEPTAGMTLSETAETADIILDVFRDRTAVVIEHDIAFVRRLDTQVTVLYRGEVLREGKFEEIAADEAVRRVYLGEDA
ncbi:ATP-binding cassette domain-containing protein [Pelagibius sp. CAU 1746]|uniref:ATP-binding cassette domain-containing protein n=1 Tax=Pelagibius sp. CAU 1746 TaxID=3140370 RepID=UPI00325BD4E5